LSFKIKFRAAQNSEDMLESLILEKDELVSQLEKYKEELESKNNKIAALEEEVELLQLEKEEALAERITFQLFF
jgi:hypothetical protein